MRPFLASIKLSFISTAQSPKNNYWVVLRKIIGSYRHARRRKRSPRRQAAPLQQYSSSRGPNKNAAAAIYCWLLLLLLLLGAFAAEVLLPAAAVAVCCFLIGTRFELAEVDFPRRPPNKTQITKTNTDNVVTHSSTASALNNTKRFSSCTPLHRETKGDRCCCCWCCPAAFACGFCCMLVLGGGGFRAGRISWNDWSLSSDHAVSFGGETTTTIILTSTIHKRTKVDDSFTAQVTINSDSSYTALIYAIVVTLVQDTQ